MMPAAGKVDKETLAEIFTGRTGFRRADVLQGPAFGVDVALIDLGNNTGLAIASDPLSILPSLGMDISAWLSVHLMANDIATTGYAPMFGQFVLNLPSSLSNRDLENYWSYIHQYCLEIGTHITGGHTGFDVAGSSTIAGGGTMFAKVDLSIAKTSAMARTGDHLVMTKSAALSSTALLALSFPAYIANKLGKETLEKAQQQFFETSVLKEVNVITKDNSLSSKITAMHDVTEGGILGAVYEMAVASDRGVQVNKDTLLVGEEQRTICELFEIDPLRSIGAGSLLIACCPHASEQLTSTLRRASIEACVIGKFTDKAAGMTIQHGDKSQPLTYITEDPYWRAYFKASAQHLK